MCMYLILVINFIRGRYRLGNHEWVLYRHGLAGDHMGEKVKEEERKPG